MRVWPEIWASHRRHVAQCMPACSLTGRPATATYAVYSDRPPTHYPAPHRVPDPSMVPTLHKMSEMKPAPSWCSQREKKSTLWKAVLIARMSNIHHDRMLNSHPPTTHPSTDTQTRVRVSAHAPNRSITPARVIPNTSSSGTLPPATTTRHHQRHATRVSRTALACSACRAMCAGTSIGLAGAPRVAPAPLIAPSTHRAYSNDRFRSQRVPRATPLQSGTRPLCQPYLQARTLPPTPAQTPAQTLAWRLIETRTGARTRSSTRTDIDKEHRSLEHGDGDSTDRTGPARQGASTPEPAVRHHDAHDTRRRPAKAAHTP